MNTKMRMVFACLFVATAHGLNGLWQTPQAAAGDCHDGLSCRACLAAGCGFFGSCLPSCDMIADVACYEGDAEKECAASEMSERDSKLCNDEGISSCEKCTAKKKADGTSCRWFAELESCMAEGGMLGPGDTACLPERRAAPKCPANCKVYFDGCNNCRCAPGGAMACTRRACIGEKERPYCREEADPEPELPRSAFVQCGGAAVPVEGSFCGRGGSRCGDGFYCHIHPADRWAVCCPDKIVGRDIV